MSRNATPIDLGVIPGVEAEAVADRPEPAPGKKTLTRMLPPVNAVHRPPVPRHTPSGGPRAPAAPSSPVDDPFALHLTASVAPAHPERKKPAADPAAATATAVTNDVQLPAARPAVVPLLDGPDVD